jgi:hypothetical protein
MEENEEVTQEVAQETNQQDSGDENVVKVDESKFESAGDDEVTKVDLTLDPPVTEEVQEESVEEAPVVDEVVEEQLEVEVEPEQEEQETVEVELPEDMQKLMEFMQETGGDLNDYVKLNSNTEEMDSSEILKDFYKKTKPHLDSDEINFLLEDNFSYDEEMDEERDVKRKKLALKEQVAEAKIYLDGQKSKYYEDIKAGSKLTSEQQEAIEFFNQYNQDNQRDTEIVKLQQSTFLNKTDKVFDSEFKGFEFDVDGENMVFNVPNVDEVKDTQKDINNFVGKFLNKERLMEDAAGYHKSLYTAMNPDLVAKHFYEQGKSDAIKQNNSQAKNINTSRETHKVYEGEGGVTYKVLGDDSNDMKLRIKKRK